MGETRMSIANEVYKLIQDSNNISLDLPVATVYGLVLSQLPVVELNNNTKIRFIPNPRSHKNVPGRPQWIEPPVYYNTKNEIEEAETFTVALVPVVIYFNGQIYKRRMGFNAEHNVLFVKELGDPE